MSESNQSSIHTSFDLEAACKEMQPKASASATLHTARTLIHERDLRVVLVVLSPGGHIKEHRAHTTASVQVLRGSIDVTLGEESVSLGVGRLLMLERDMLHSVVAKTESAFLLTLGQPS